MRYAKARLLAELPTDVISERDLELVDAIARRLQTDGDRVGVTIGDPFMGKQMAMRLSPSGPSVPATVEDADFWGYRSVPGQLEQLAAPEFAPQQFRAVDFGYVDEGQPLSESIIYQSPRTEAGKEFAAGQGFKQQLRAALPQLVERAGMKPGDVLINTPEGMADSDYRRALTYMRQGFGLPANEHQQMARLTAGGELMPIQPFMANQALVRALGWKEQAPISMANAPSS